MRLVPFVVIVAVFALSAVQVASAAPAVSTPITTGVGAAVSGVATNTSITATNTTLVAAVVPVTKPGKKNILTPAQIALVARRAGFTGSSLVTAVAVALAESTGNADAISRSRAYGLWQVLARAHPDMIRSSNPNVSRWFDPYTNARFAWKISNGGKNWKPWSVYKHGSYKKFLAKARAGVYRLTTSPEIVTTPVAK